MHLDTRLLKFHGKNPKSMHAGHLDLELLPICIPANFQQKGLCAAKIQTVDHMENLAFHGDYHPSPDAFRADKNLSTLEELSSHSATMRALPFCMAVSFDSSDSISLAD